MLPDPLVTRLEGAPRWVVAPVGLGFGQEALHSWARTCDRVVVQDPATLSASPALLVVARRTDLDRLPPDWSPEETLFLDEHDLLFDRAAWDAALPDTSAAFRWTSYQQAGGWPEGLKLARQLSATAPADLTAHPLVRTHLTRFLPGSPLREALACASRTPLLLPALHDLIGLAHDDVSELHDLGFLYQDSGGLRVPPLLRLLLRPRDPRHLEVARALVTAQHVPEGLTVLAEAGSWVEYLDVLSGWFKASMGEDALRGWLARVPASWREHAAYLYLSGLLERIKGEFGRAEEQYDRALQRGGPEIAPTVQNARGVALALMGRHEEALESFEQATHGPSRLTAGEAWHNRAGILIQLQRYAEAETSLQEAISAFRASGDYTREARTLQLLGTFYFSRGLLAEAERTYRDALHLLSTIGTAPTALVRVNFAHVLCLLGDLARAEREQALATRELGDGADQRAWGWTQLNAALLRLSRSDVSGAEEHLNALLLSGLREQSLMAEAHLLLARIHRLRGDVAQARASLQHASRLGLRARLEEALIDGTGLEDVIAQARREEARYELAMALLHTEREEDLREALGLIRSHRYQTLLQSPAYAQKLIGLSEHDASLRDLFPMHVRLLGGFQVRFLGRAFALGDFPTRKSAALFLALVLTERPLPRETLAERFWPGAKNPLGSLQTATYHLRAALGAPVVRSERGLLSLAFPVTTDLTEVEAAIAEAATLPPPARLEAVQKALRGVGPYLLEFPEDFGDERAYAESRVMEWRRQLVQLSPPGSEAQRDALRALIAADPYDIDARHELIALLTERGEHDAVETERGRLREIELELS